jgi:acetyl-CoA/propionyl-CoA carboxylase biotin carboxyl carrier protein
MARTGPHTWALDVDGERREWTYARDGEVTWVGCEGHAWPVRTSAVSSAQDAQADGDLRAPMPGQVLLIPAGAGHKVRAGDPVVVLESMKMELVLTAPVDGEVTELSVAVGDTVAVDQPLARVEAA